MKSVCVFCGSSAGVNPVYREAAETVGRALAEAGVTVVYGGGRVGLMGAVADAALQAGGRVIGVMPRFLVEKEIAHQGLTSLEVVTSMHERKTRMAELSDAFLALPGGFGTFEELCEIVTWSQLKLHSKPCAILNVAGYYDALLVQIERALAEGFMKEESRSIVVTVKSVQALLELI